MRRRGFLFSGITGLIAGQADFASAQPSQPSDSPPPDLFRLTSRYRKETSKTLFTGANRNNETPPHIYLFFDGMKFVNPVDLAANLQPAKYTLDVELLAFGLSNDSKQKLSVDNKKDVQLTLKVDAAQSNDEDDTLSWVFMNAIDVFVNATRAADTKKAKGGDKGADKGQNSGNLTTFKQNNKPTAALKPVSKISIPQGSVDLQVIALGQKKGGFWRTFLAAITKLSTSPLFAAFGLPALVPEALAFVNTSLNQLAHTSEGLQPIWQSASIPFGIFQNSNASFKLKEGYWIIVDREYALKTKYLEGHAIDLRGQTFSLIRADQQLADASYLVTLFKFTQAKKDVSGKA